MAIYKYTPASPVVDLTEAAAFLNSYKSGSFLGSATISGDSTSLTIMLGTISFVLNCGTGISQGSQHVYCALKSGTTVKKSFIFSPNVNGAYFKLSGFYFCKNGIIFNVAWEYLSAEHGTICALTVNESGDLVIMAVDSTRLSEDTGAFTAFDICSSESYTTKINTNVVTTDYLTALAGLAVAFTGNIIKKCDNAFFAYESQAATSNYTGLYTLSLNQVAYISNGVWYIKDE